jgi:hypothetical protein
MSGSASAASHGAACRGAGAGLGVVAGPKGKGTRTMKATLRFLSGSSVIAMALFGSAAGAQDATCTPRQQAMEQTAQTYRSQYDGYQHEGEDLKKDAVAFDVDVKWKDTDIIFDLPSVTMRNQDIIFGVPQTTVKDREMRFGVPGIRMVRHKTGQYPETTCHDTWIRIGPLKTKGAPSCTVTWHDIYIDIPEPYVQQVRIVMGIPEFRWDDTRIVMGIPEVTMQRQRWVVGVPQFTVRSTVLNPGPIEDRSSSLQNRIAETRQNQQRDMTKDLSGLYGCYRDGIAQKRADTANLFAASINQLDTIIKSVTQQGGNPAALEGQDGTTSDLVARRADLVAKRDAALASFDKSLTDLDMSEKTAVAGLSPAV